MSWTKTLSDEKTELLMQDTCPSCGTATLTAISKSGRTCVCEKCNDAFIKPNLGKKD